MLSHVPWGLYVRNWISLSCSICRPELTESAIWAQPWVATCLHRRLGILAAPGTGLGCSLKSPVCHKSVSLGSVRPHLRSCHSSWTSLQHEDEAQWSKCSSGLAKVHFCGWLRAWGALFPFPLLWLQNVKQNSVPDTHWGPSIVPDICLQCGYRIAHLYCHTPLLTGSPGWHQIPWGWALCRDNTA